MSTSVAEQSETSLALTQPPKTGILYPVTPAIIESKKDEFLALRINGVNDEKGITEVNAALKVASGWRIATEKAREDAKQEYLVAGRKVDADARVIQKLIEPVESHLVSEKKRVADELAKAEQAKLDVVFNQRQQRLCDAGDSTFAPRAGKVAVLKYRDEEFDALVESVAADTKRKQAEDAERQRVAEENRIAAEKLEADRAEFRRQQEEAAAETARLKKIQEDADNERRAELLRLRQEQDARDAAAQAELDRQRRDQEAREENLRAAERLQQQAETERQQKIRDEQLAAEAAERARVETEERLSREAQEKEARRVADEAAAKRAAELRPAKDKLAQFAMTLLHLDYPTVSPEVDVKIVAVINAAAEGVRLIVKELA